MRGQEITDRLGQPIQLGSRVRVIEIPPDALNDRSVEEHSRISSMLGEVLEVIEIDPQGGVWVEKWWHLSPSRSASHSLTLAPSQFELVQ